MEYRLVQQAVDKILNEAKTENGFFGWANPATNLSRTVTAQVIITLSRCSEFETDTDRKKKIFDAIQKGFVYLKESIKTGNCELPTFTFTLMAHLEHHERHPSEYPFDIDLITFCITEIRDNSNDFYYEPEKAYQYSNSIDRKYFPTYLALQTFLHLLSFLEKNPTVILTNLTLDDLKVEIDNCFKYIFAKLQMKIPEINNLPFLKNAEYLSVGVQIAKHYEDYSKKYNRIPNITNTKVNLDTAIDYFTDNLEADVFNSWHIRIDRTPFDLVYVSNLISGLLKCRSQLSEKGLELLFRVSYFLCTDDRIQNKDTNGNILSTKIPKAPVWGTAHSLNAILKLDCSVNELKWINEKPKEVRIEVEKIVEKEVSKEIHSIKRIVFMHFSKTVVGRIFLPIIISAFSTVLMYKFLLNELSITNAFLLQAIFIVGSLAAYFFPQFVLYGLIKSKEQFEKNKIWFEFTYVFLAIIAYIIIILYYSTNKS